MTDIALPLPDGRWLVLTREQFDAALAAGAELSAHHAPSSAVSEPLLDAEQAGLQLAISPRWLEDSARAGIIPHHKLGRFLRFRVSEIAKHCHVAGAAIPKTDLATDTSAVGNVRRLRGQ